ncbi:hypothetical protein GSY74_09410 [Sulfurovum sp. bin170]|uniref:hypothetical protein n=1 Tax=Sulfurovum sp. bin170 TaxID=2695268 RepID=UPI0013DFF935|nr:hypothetical protein [Sulfurovum sp. bin170]NEW61498.1 hypothetical protein [Sulfurovum sp. bin170]
MFESTPIIIITVIILSALIGGIIGNILSRVSYQCADDDIDSETTHTFHVDGATGIVSDATSIKYHK